MEERYPPVCASCAPNVQARLQRNNYIAKSTALGRWLTSTKYHSRSTLVKGSFLQYIRACIWILRGSIWVASCLSMISWYMTGALSPANQKFGMASDNMDGCKGSVLNESGHLTQESIRESLRLKRMWLPVSLLGALWSPKGLAMLLNQSLRIDGRSEYIKLQLFIQSLRFLTIYILPYLDLSTDMHKRLSILFLGLSILHPILSFNVLSVTSKTRVDLRDTSATRLKDSIPEQVPMTDTTPHHQSVFQLGSSRPDPILSEDSGEDEDTMDWQPSPKPSQILPPQFSGMSFGRSSHALSPFATSHPLPSGSGLAKQRFFAPERPTGLETLFNAAVNLEDEPMLVRSIKSVQKSPRPMALTFLISTVLMMPALYCNKAVLAQILGSTLFLASAYLGIAKGWDNLATLLWPLVSLVQFFPASEKIKEMLLWSAGLLSIWMHGYWYIRIVRESKKRQIRRTKKNF